MLPLETYSVIFRKTVNNFTKFCFFLPDDLLYYFNIGEKVFCFL